jgi:hypothetical protein
MKVIQENESQMTLRARPWSLWVLGAVFTGFGLFMVVSGSDNTLSCRRDNTAPPSCELSKKSLLSSQQQVLPLEDIQRTTVQAYRRRNSSLRSYSLGLVTKTGVINPIGSHLISNEKTVQDFQEFFKDTERKYLFLKYDGRFYWLPVAVIFIPIGLLVLVCARPLVCQIDKKSGKLTLINYGLRSKSQAEYNINDIQLISLQSLVSKSYKTYRIIFMMQSGELLPLTPDFYVKLQEQEKMAIRLSNFLNLQYFPPNTN